LLGLYLAGTAAQTPARWPIDGFLREYARASAADLAALERGQPVVRTLDTGDSREVAVVGAIRLEVPKEFFLERFRDIVNTKKSEGVLQVGKFGSVPLVGDIASLRLDTDDLNALGRCRIDDCDVKLTGAMIERVRAEIDWTARDRDDRATALIHRLLTDHATAFLAGGDRARAKYADRPRALDPSAAFEGILTRSAHLGRYAPELRDYLQRFPAASLPDSERFLYWSKEIWGPMRVVSLTHVTIYPRPSAHETLIATRNIYATHVLDASLGLLVIADTVSGGASGSSYLFYLNHSRVDVLQGFLGGLRRSIVQRGQRQSMDRYIREAKTRMEAAYREAGPRRVEPSAGVWLPKALTASGSSF
jgi:hypothetical protein